MTFQEKHLSFISIISGLLLIFYGIIQDKSSNIDNSIFQLNSQRNIETLDYILLSRDKSELNKSSNLVTIKKVLIEEYDDKIAKLLVRQSRLGNYTIFMILSIVLLNLSVYFPLSHGDFLKSKKAYYLIYRIILYLALCASVIFLLFAFFV